MLGSTYYAQNYASIMWTALFQHWSRGRGTCGTGSGTPAMHAWHISKTRFVTPYCLQNASE